MPSKGVQVYTYIAVPGCSIELSVPKQTVVKNDVRVFSNQDLEVDAKNIDNLFNKTGRFTFKVIQNGVLITEQWVEINALTVGIVRGTMNTIANTSSVLHGNTVVVSYSFYAAGPGQEGLPSRHQCNITVSPNYGGWMGDVAPDGSPHVDRPFHSLVLPAVHDVGMNSMQNCDAVLSHAGSAVIYKLLANDKLGKEIDTISGPVVELIAPNIVASLAMTQKDSLNTMLQIGARYFEFRPAHCHRDVLPTHALPDRLYFQHSAIPGMAYEEFLHDVVAFLLAHPSEIVVTQLRWDGVPAECARPSAQEMAQYLSAALAPANGALVAGNLDDLRGSSIAQLRHDRKRLIMLVNADSLSTYTDLGNATLNGDSIVTEFGTSLVAQNEAGRGFINIQCQATPTNIPGAVTYSVLSASASNSCLLATKALCDSKTLPWVRDNALRVCGTDDLVVVMNDFFDGATADVCVRLSRARLG